MWHSSPVMRIQNNGRDGNKQGIVSSDILIYVTTRQYGFDWFRGRGGGMGGKERDNQIKSDREKRRTISTGYGRLGICSVGLGLIYLSVGLDYGYLYRRNSNKIQFNLKHKIIECN